MRTRDDQKKEALFRATVKLVNEIGFAASSVSKIAKEANVSPSTLYVFFKNKEDLLISTYLELKRHLRDALQDGLDDTLPIRDIVKNAWFGVFQYVSSNLDEYGYMEQFANSPYSERVDRETLDKEFIPIINVILKGIEQKILKDVDINLLAAFMFEPISRLANPRLCYGLDLDEKDIETAFDMAWDAIRR